MLRYFAIFLLPFLLTIPAFAGDGADKPFVKKRYAIHGTAKIEAVDGKKHLVFSEGFKTKNGPDLKIYLSSLPLEELSSENVGENAVRLSVLRSNKGQQSYVIPDTINLDEFESVIIHCEAFTVLWGGFDL